MEGKNKGERPVRKKGGRKKIEKNKTNFNLQDYKDALAMDCQIVPLSDLSSPGAVSDRINLALDTVEKLTGDLELALEKILTMNRKEKEMYDRLKGIPKGLFVFLILFHISLDNELETLKSFSDLFNSTFNWKKCEILCDLKHAYKISDLKAADWVISRRVGRMFYHKTDKDNHKVPGKCEVKRKLVLNAFSQFMEENTQPTSLTGRRSLLLVYLSFFFSV
jgi:hypothetical protein